MWTTRSTLLVLGLALILIAGAVQAADVEPGGDHPSAQSTAQSTYEPPSPRQTLAAFGSVESWVRDWAVDAADSAAALPPCYGACVHLRLHGELVGRGAAMVGSAADPPTGGFIRAAAAEAIRSAERRLPLPNDLQREAARKLLTPDIQISLELAGSLIPIVDDSWSLIDTSLAPGLDGLIVRRDGVDQDQGLRFEFPSQMMLGGGLPQRSIRSITAGVIGEGGAAEVLLMPREIREKHAVKMYRFRVSHVAQCGPRLRPEFLYRGSRLVPAQAVNRAGLHEMATRAADWLQRLSDAGDPDGSGLGVYRAWDHRWEHELSSFSTDALAAIALYEYARFAASPRHKQAAGRILGRLTAIVADADALAKIDAAAVAMGLQAAGSGLDLDRQFPAKSPGAIEDVSPLEGLGRELAPRVRVLFATDRGLSRDLASPARAAVAWALVESGVANRWSIEPEIGARALSAELMTASASQLVASMPWLGWAAVARSRGGGEHSDVPGAVLFREMRSEVWKHQLTSVDAGDDGADMVGGIVFTSGNTSPLPTWQGARPLCFLATMLGEPRLTEPGERAVELARMLQAARFLRQLQADDSGGWMYPRPDTALGGIRGAVWDHTLNPDATSLTLLAVVELLKSMDKVAPDILKQASPVPADFSSPAKP